MSRTLDVPGARSWWESPLQLLENYLSVQKLSSVSLVQADLDLATEVFYPQGIFAVLSMGHGPRYLL